MCEIQVYKNGYDYWTIRVELQYHHKFFYISRKEKLRFFKNFDFGKLTYREEDGKFFARIEYCQRTSCGGERTEAVMCAFDFAERLHQLDPIENFTIWNTEKEKIDLINRRSNMGPFEPFSGYDLCRDFLVRWTKYKNMVLKGIPVKTVCEFMENEKDSKISDKHLDYVKKNGINYKTIFW